jgi:hypothetical protein
MRRVTLWAIGIGLVVTVGLLTAERGNAERGNAERGNAEEEGKHHPSTCTLETLKGRYLFASSGTLLPPAFGVTEPTPGADAGYHTFNGDGTGTDTVTVRIGTNIVQENLVAPISYTVKADCTGTLIVPNGPSFDLFIAPNGEAISRISTAPPGNYVSSIDRRVSPK